VITSPGSWPFIEIASRDDKKAEKTVAEFCPKFDILNSWTVLDCSGQFNEETDANASEVGVMATISKKQAREIVAGLGGAQAVHRGLLDYSARVAKMDEQRPSLTKQYPDKWAAMGDDGIVATADSLNALLKEVDEAGISRLGLVVEHLSTKPRNMIL
jgi:hypothetical protein